MLDLDQDDPTRVADVLAAAARVYLARSVLMLARAENGKGHGEAWSRISLALLEASINVRTIADE